MIRFSNVVLCSFSLRHILKHKSIKIRLHNAFLKVPKNGVVGGRIFLFFVNFVPVSRVKQDVNK